jgi:hypothetical protein
LLGVNDYRIDDYRYLVRTDGEAWPCCQDLLADPVNDDNTFSVSYTYGSAPPAAGVLAAADLACELAKSCAGQECTLPSRVQSITRQGMSMVLLDPFDFLERGKVGIYTVDLFLRAYNPSGLRRPSRVLSPDIGQRARRVGT